MNEDRNVITIGKYSIYDTGKGLSDYTIMNNETGLIEKYFIYYTDAIEWCQGY